MPMEEDPTARPAAPSGESHSRFTAKKRAHEDSNTSLTAGKSDKGNNDPLDKQGARPKKKQKMKQDHNTGLTA